ncbi:MAG TPA: histidine kinase, partial [Bacteroidales bacterium]|nr:histidine kinase [Bacteroidales bacterium]
MPDHKLFQRLPIAPLIAVVGIVLSILLIPLRISRDTLNVTDRQLLANDQVALVHNLDDDPEPGLVRMKHNVLGQAALSIDDHNRGTLDQHNLKGRFRNMGGSTVVSDVDADGSADVMTLTMEADTLWLFVLYAAGKESRLASWPVDTLHGLDTFTDLSLQMFGPVDLDADGSREILFTANAGFSLHPRAVYALDPRNGKVTQSPELGNKVVVREVADLDGDGRPELFLHSASFGNHPDRRPRLHDHSAYLLVLDYRLQLLFPAVEFRGDRLEVIPFPFMDKDKPSIACIHGDRATGVRLLGLYDLQGRQILEDSLAPDGTPLYFALPVSNFGKPGKDPLLLGTGGVLRIRSGLETEWERRMEKCLKDCRFLPVPSTSSPRFFYSYDPLNMRYWLVDGQESRFTFMQSLNTCGQEIRNIGLLDPRPEETLLFMQAGPEMVLLSWKPNPWYPWGYLHYAGIILFWVGLVALIQRVTQVSIRHQYETAQRMQSLELLTLKNQVTPHFVFNAINSIGSLIYRDKKEQAYRYLGQFSDLLRSSLTSSNHASVALEEELAFIRNYLELEKLRFDTRFD